MMNDRGIYHERQMRELCALHALNNLLQAPGSFVKSELDEICEQLSPSEWINPHRSVLGLGNYDINVLMTALQTKGFETIWFDKRKNVKCIDLDQIYGFILNVPSDYKLGFVVLPLRRRHWIAIRRIHGLFWNLDSKLNAPECIGDDAALLGYLNVHLQSNDKELFIVVGAETEKNRNWLKCEPEP